MVGAKVSRYRSLICIIEESNDAGDNQSYSKNPRENLAAVAQAGIAGSTDLRVIKSGMAVSGLRGTVRSASPLRPSR